MVRLSTLIALCLLPASASAAPQHGLRWMLGSWCQQSANGTRTCERWRVDRHGRMLGEGHTTRQGKPAERETMRIRARRGNVYFEASQGGPFTAFRRSATGARAATFINAKHDYPQRIRYWREGDMLLAEIALADGSKAMQWRYTRGR